jgi:hypothetical protein
MLSSLLMGSGDTAGFRVKSGALAAAGDFAW